MFAATVVLGLAAAASAAGTTRRFVLNSFQPNTTCSGPLGADAKRLVTDYYEVVDGASCYNMHRMGACDETFKNDNSVKLCSLVVAEASRRYAVEKDTTGAERLRISDFSNQNCTGFPTLSVVYPLGSTCYNTTQGKVSLKELAPAGEAPAKDGLLVNSIGEGACPATGKVVSKAPVGLCVPFVESQLSIPNLYPGSNAASGAAAKTYVRESFDGSAGVIVQHFVDKDCTTPYFDATASAKGDITAQSFAYYFPFNTCMGFTTRSAGQNYTWNQKFTHEAGAWNGSVGGGQNSAAHRNTAPTTGALVTVLVAFVASMVL